MEFAANTSPLLAVCWILFGAMVGAGAAWGGRTLTRILPVSKSWYEGVEYGEAEPAPPGFFWKTEADMPPTGIPLLWWYSAGRPKVRRGEVLLDMALMLAGAAAALWHGPSVIGIACLGVFAMAYLIGRVDHDHNMVPDILVIPLALAGLLFSPFDADDYSRIVGLTVAMTTVWVVFALYGRVRRTEVMMGGDIILAGAGGAWLGTEGAPAFLLLSVAIFVTHVLVQHMRSGQPWRSVGSKWNAMGPAMCAALVLLTLFGH